MSRVALLCAVLIALAWAPTPQACARPPQQAPSVSGSSLREIPTRFYTVFTDLPQDTLETILPRLQRMAQEYEKRTRSLSAQQDDRRLPFYLFARQEEYQKAGGAEDSAGLFDGERLLACTGRQADDRAWHVIQHEAFHQYLTRRLGYEIPVWLNEGMAEYFGESLYTGDGFVSGIIPGWRLTRVQKGIEDGSFIPLRELLSMPLQTWNDSLKLGNYDQAWSLVQFLAHGAGGRYQQGLLQYLQQTSRGIDSLKGFRQYVGEPDDIQRQWEQYLHDYSRAMSERSAGEAAVQTVCSFAGRAVITGQKITSLDQLLELASQGKLQQPKGDALPLELLLEQTGAAPAIGQWQVNLAPKAHANVQLTLRDGTRICARYALRLGRVESVESWIDEPPTGDRRRVR